MATFRILASALLIALSAAALASEIELSTAASKAQFESIKAQLTSQLETDKYKEIKPDDKQMVVDALGRIQSHYDKVAEADLLSPQDRVDMYNDQEIINTIITHAAVDSRLVCERITTTGSHLVRISCMTLATLKERQQAGQDSMGAVQHKSNASFTGATTMKAGATQ